MSDTSGEFFSRKTSLESISDKFTEAYERQIEGESPIHTMVGFGGRIEMLGLNPKRPNLPGDNVRYLISRGTLGFGGLEIKMGEEEFDISYGVIKITLAPGDDRPIAELEPEDLELLSFLMVSSEGEIAGGAGWLLPEEQGSLLMSMEDCVLSAEVPIWAQEFDIAN